MTPESLKRKLVSLSDEASALRNELRISEEHLQHFEQEAEDARLRSLVSETPLAADGHRQAAGAYTAAKRDRDSLLKKLGKLERKQDELLDRLQKKQSF